MFRNRILISLCLFTILLSACKARQAVPTPDLSLDVQPTDSAGGTDFETKVEWGECPFDSGRVEAQCGYLTVPLDYSQPGNGETLRLSFVRYETQGEAPKPDPILLLVPFPLMSQAGFLPFLFEELYKEHDLLLLDLRGMGLSEPQLVCPEIQSGWWESLPTGALTSENWGELHQDCRSNLEAQQINLDAYNLAAMANDLKSLRTSLEYPEWNVVSLGDGAYLAYELLHVDPGGIRTLMLDSTVPFYTEKPSYYAAANDLLHTVFDLCAQDTDCGETFPDIEQAFYEVVEKLNAEPVTIVANDSNSGRQTDELVDGNRLIALTLQLIRNNDLERVGQIPRMIYQLRDGKTTTLEKMAGLMLAGEDYTLQGIYSLINCRQFPVPDENEANTALAGLPAGLVSYFSKVAKDNQAICAAWEPLPPVAPTNYSSDTPILLLNGSWDWGSSASLVESFQQVARGVQVATFPMAGNYLFFARGTSECSHEMLGAFIEDPDATLDMQCTGVESDITWITMR